MLLFVMIDQRSNQLPVKVRYHVHLQLRPYACPQINQWISMACLSLALRMRLPSNVER
jgi:hypothetical protein